MRPRDVQVWLADVLVAGEFVGGFVEGRTFAEYRCDEMFSSAVERKLEIVGEALNRILRADHSLEAELPEAPRVIGFRNILAHGYDRVSDALVWSIATESLPVLLDKARALLDEQ